MNGEHVFTAVWALLIYGPIEKSSKKNTLVLSEYDSWVILTCYNWKYIYPRYNYSCMMKWSLFTT